MGGYLQFAALNKLLRKILMSLGLTVVQHWQALKPLLANQPVFSRIAFWVLSFVFLLTKTNFSRLLQARLQGLALLYSQHPSAFTCEYLLILLLSCD